MWFASWWVHFARYPWTTGAALFHTHLLDGEPGPNALSWQWVASTYSAKPYVVHGDNMRRFGLEPGEGAPFDGDRAVIDERVFGGFASGGYARRISDPPTTHRRSIASPPTLQGTKPVIVLHGERLSPRARVLHELEERPVAVILEGRRFERERASLGRTGFAVRLAADLVDTLQAQGRRAVLVWAEDDAAWSEAVESLGGDAVATPDSWHPGTRSTLGRLATAMPVSVVPDEPFVDVDASLKSFSSFWSVAESQVNRRFAPTKA
jgi:deoxyribodipyrimidine photo-lyase